MILENKFLNIDYIGRLCVGVARFDLKNDEVLDSLKCLAKLMSYVIEDNTDLLSVLPRVYETDNPIYLKILGHMIHFKIINPNIKNEEIKQKLIDLVENKVDNATFSKVFKFVNAIFTNMLSNNISNVTLDREFEKLLKYILLNNSYNKISTLYKKFYEDEGAIDSYESTVSGIFKQYNNSIISKDIMIDNTLESVSSAFGKASKMNEEVRVVELFEEIRFVEKKRVAIAVGMTGSGKSMFLCHCAADYAMRTKFTDKKKIIFYFTFENSQEETFVRIMSNVLEVTIDDIKELIATPEGKADLTQRYLELIDKHTFIKIVELPPKKHSMATIEAEIEKELLKHSDAEVYAVLLDYVDKMLPITISASKREDQKLGDVVDEFKALTKKYECAGITVSQVNRSGAKNKDEWDITNIGGSWEKVENADIVLLFYVEDTYDELGYNTAIFKNVKHRYHRDGKIFGCIYKPQYAKFYRDDSEVNELKKVFPDVEESSNQISDSTALASTSLF